MINWLTYSALNRPSSPDSASDNVVAQSLPSTPSSNRVGDTVEFKSDVVAPIVSLLYLCSPLTVIRGVISIVVDTFNAMGSRRTLTHISKEVLERIPSRADFNSSASVRCVFQRMVATSNPHTMPCAVLRSMGKVMCFGSFIVATAGLCSTFVFGVKRIASNYAKVSTVADAVEIDSVLVSAIKQETAGFSINGNSNKLTKALPDFIKGDVHNILHSMLSIRKNVAICMEAELRVAFPSHKHMIA